VEEHGEFAQRGSILDLFPMSSSVPFRIECFDDEIETIRSFDAESQRSLDKVPEVALLPAYEFPMNEEGIQHFRRAFRNRFAAESKNCPLYRDVSEGRAPAGIEYYMPLFFEHTATLMDYLPTTTRVISVADAFGAMHAFYENTAERYEQRRHDVMNSDGMILNAQYCLLKNCT